MPSHTFTIINVTIFSLNHSFIPIRVEATVKDRAGIFEKTLNKNIHYSKSLVFKKYFSENLVHTLGKLLFYTGPKIWRTL